MSDNGHVPYWITSKDKLHQKQHMLVRIVDEKKAFVTKLRSLYSELNSTSEPNLPISSDLRENLDRLLEEISTADHTLARYQNQLRDVREEISGGSRVGFLPNTKTIEIVLYNGDCTITAAEEFTIKEACLRSNRFMNININRSRLERYITNESHSKETQYVNWGDPSIEYANCKLYFSTTDEDYLRSVAPGTHSFEAKLSFFPKCDLCHRRKVERGKKCSSCKLTVCSECEKKMTKICESVNDDKRPEEKAVPPPPPVHRDEWKVSRNDVTGPGDDGQDWQPVGEGTWGIVYKANYHGPAAVKKLKCKSPSREQIHEFQSEVAILSKLRHNQIVLFMAYILDPPDDMCIVMSWCESSLYKRIHIGQTHLTVPEAMRISKEISQGMEYLHSKQIVHRDLKSSNIFLASEKDSENSVKIGDFGLAKSKKTFSKTDQVSSPSGSLYWMSPEILRCRPGGPSPYTNYADVYAFGVVLFELFAGELPYCEKKFLAPEMLIFMVGSGRMKPDLGRLNPKADGRSFGGAQSCPSLMRKFIESCLNYEAERRPEFNRPRNNESILTQLNKIEMRLNEEKLLAQASVLDDSKKNISMEKPHSWKIDMQDITNLQPVGEGAWGKVYKAKWHGPVAVKKLKCETPTKDQIEGFRQEVNMLRKCRHENIVLFMSYILNPPEHMCIVMHWCASSLYKLIHVKKDTISVRESLRIAKETAQGMGYLHSKKIVHRDLKSSNIFLDGDDSVANPCVKIGDFGLAVTKKTASRGQSNQPTDARKVDIQGSLFWMAPEILTHQESNPYTVSSDMYAYGIVLFELFAGELPYFDIQFLQPEILIFMVGSGRKVPDLTRLNPKTPKSGGAERTPELIRRLILSSITKEPNERPCFEECDEHGRDCVITVLERAMKSERPMGQAGLPRRSNTLPHIIHGSISRASEGDDLNDSVLSVNRLDHHH